MKEQTELEKHEILRQNNHEANAITRECIESALILLMKNKRFDEISVTDITRKAGVSRTAYYRNYTSKEDILSEYMRNIHRSISEILKQFDAVTETEKSWLALLTAVEQIATQYKLLLDAGFGGKIISEFATYMNENTHEGDSKKYFSSFYWAGAIFSVVSEWVSRGMQTPKEEIAFIGASLMTEGIRTAEKFGNSCK